MISDEDKERVRQATDVLSLVGETVELRQQGPSFWGCCPFHQEKSPSFHVDPQTGLWKCFGCGEAGDIFSFVMRREGLEFTDAVRYLADRAGIELQEERGGTRGPRRGRLIEALEEAERFYATMLLRGKGSGPNTARHYLGGRGMGADICRRWGLGYAPGGTRLVSHLCERGFTSDELMAADLATQSRGQLRDRFFERAMFPIHDRQGHTIAFGGRVMGEGNPKYLNSKETSVFHKSKHLYALDKAKEAIVATGEAVVCEGYTDVIAMHEAGIAQTVAALGTSFSEDHVRTLSGLAKTRIICLFDGDNAGQRAAERALQYLDKTKLDLVCVVLPDNQDPAEYLADHGVEAMRDQLAQARPLVDFVFERRLAGFDLKVPGQRAAALDGLATVLAPLLGSMLLGQFVTSVAQLLHVSEDEVHRVIRVKAEQRRRAMRTHTATDEAPLSPAPYEVAPTYDSLAVLSADERFQMRAERELLSLLARDPEPVRALGERIAGISWCDPRHEVMAWAMLSAPQDVSGQGLVAMASRMVPEAPQILSGGEVSLFAEQPAQDKARFLVDILEMASCRRQIGSEQARLRLERDSDQSALIGRRIMALQRRIAELERELPASIEHV